MTPHELGEKKLELSAEYERLSELLSELDKKRPFQWVEVRKTCKSVKEADMLYDMSEDGQATITIKSRLQAIEKRVSAISSMLYILNNEARNGGF